MDVHKFLEFACYLVPSLSLSVSNVECAVFPRAQTVFLKKKMFCMKRGSSLTVLAFQKILHLRM